MTITIFLLSESIAWSDLTHKNSSKSFYFWAQGQMTRLWLVMSCVAVYISGVKQFWRATARNIFAKKLTAVNHSPHVSITLTSYLPTQAARFIAESYELSTKCLSKPVFHEKRVRLLNEGALVVSKCFVFMNWAAQALYQRRMVLTMEYRVYNLPWHATLFWPWDCDQAPCLPLHPIQIASRTFR